jgi:hypothetical protein
MNYEALLPVIGSLVGTFAGIVTSARLTNYRLEKLEQKVDKHNNVIERTYRLVEKVNHLEKTK